MDDTAPEAAIDPDEATSAAEVVTAPEGEEDEVREQGESISEPAKLLRIVSMVRELLDETRQTAVDEQGRERLRQIYDRSLLELKDVLSPDLQDELAALAVPLEHTPSESEIRIAQAQLVGWLEGLFHGIQAAIWSQQMAARQQFEEMRRRGLPTPGGPGGPQAPGAGAGDAAAPGQYL